MRRSFKFLMRPTCKRAAALAAMLEDHRRLYNAALEERRKAWRKRVSITYSRQSAQLPEIRKADLDGQGRWGAGSQQQTLRRLDRAFQEFFRRVKAGETPGVVRLYALLVYVKGADTTLEDMHNAWALWAALERPDKRSLVPFDQLPARVQELDRPYLEVIHRVAERLRPDGPTA